MRCAGIDQTCRRMGRALLAVALAVLLLLTATPVQLVRAENDAVFEKKEVVYASLDSRGQQEAVYVVNNFEVKKGGLLEDYGNYEQLTRLTGDEKLDYQDGRLKVNVPAGLWYYQGQLKNPKLPWTFRFDYYLDGKAVEAKDLSGRSGHLKIVFVIKGVDGPLKNFAEHYMMQVGFTLDPQKIDNIQAPGATLADAGQNRVVNYIILPGMDQSWELEGDIQNFSMEAPVISAILLDLDPKALDMKSDFAKQLKQLGDLHKGIEKLNEGSGKLAKGGQDLLKAGEMIENGLGTLSSKGDEMKSGATELLDGLTEYLNGVNQFYGGVIQAGMGSSQVEAGAEKFAEGLNELACNSKKLREGSEKILFGLNMLHVTLHHNIEENQAALDALSKLDVEELQKIFKAFDLDGTIEALEALQTFLKSIDPQQFGDLDFDQMIQDLKKIRELLEPIAATNPEVQKILERFDKFLAWLEAQKNFQNLLKDLGTKLDQMINLLKQLKEIQSKVDLTKLMSMVQQIQMLDDGVAQLAAGYQEFHLGLDQFIQGVWKLRHGFDNLNPQKPGLLQGIQQLNKGLQELYQTAEKKLRPANQQILEGLDPFREGIDAYLTGVSNLYAGFQQYRAGEVKLFGGLSELGSGVGQLADETSILADWQDPNALKHFMEKMGQKPFIHESFVSPKNPTSTKVQFVIKTADIPAPPPPPAPPENAPKKGFWELVKDLFR